MNSEFCSEMELSAYITQIVEKSIIDMGLEIFYRLEVPAPGCIPDMILVEERESFIYYLISIEFKLSNWRRALYQAFRYRNFGNESYVILDRSKANSALENIKIFKQANIGLITVENSKDLVSWFLPKPELPFSKEFSYDVVCSLRKPKKPKNQDLLFTTDMNSGLCMSKLKSIWV